MKKLFIILLIVVIAILNYSYIYYLQHRNDYKEENKIDNIIQETKQDIIIILEYEIINDPVRFVLVTYIKGEVITESMSYYKFKELIERGKYENRT